MELGSVVPWGRSLDEYRLMFQLSEADVQRRLLSCCDGASSLNAELTAKGANVVSVDPLYALSTEQIAARIDHSYPLVVEHLRHNRARYHWYDIPSVDALGEQSRNTMQEFLEDYSVGKAQGRYREASLPKIPFTAEHFDLALCSHRLFFYADQLGLAWHLQSAKELCRVAKEVRIFPLVDQRGERSAYLEPVVEALREQGIQAELVPVNYRFERGADEMLLLKPMSA